MNNYKNTNTLKAFRGFFFIVFIALCINSSYAQIEKRVASQITHVTVFRSQAQVLRTAKVELNSGVTNLVFEKLSPFINQSSIEVKADANITLLSVSTRNNYLKTENNNIEINQLEDSLESINALLADFKADKETIVYQKDLMLANKNVGSNQQGVKTDELEDLMVLYKKKLDEFKTDWFRISALEKKYSFIKQKVEKQLAEFKSGQTELSYEIVVSVKSDDVISNANIELSYIVENVTWQPFFDIRVKDTKSKFQLFVKANITQSSGEDWKNVNLKLTTSNPSEGGIKPELQPNWLRFYQQQMYIDGISSEPMQVLELHATKVRSKSEENYKNVEVNQESINTEFVVNIPYSIPSDNVPHQVDLTNENYEAEYLYAAVPKLDKDAFVTAKVAANDLINQISGEANIYFDGTFTGKTFLNGTAQDTLTISLGRDKRILVERTKLKDFCSKSFFGGSKKENSTFEITIRNTRKEPIKIVVEDQIPISTSDDIEVKLIEYSGASYDEKTGKLIWIITLLPEQTQKVKFGFEVKYPSSKQISQY